jgi:hypothetical protein
MREAAREEAVAVHREAAEAQVVEEPEFRDAGYDETLPGQVEVVAGSVEHTQLLNAYRNATSYGPEHNVVVPEPEVPEEPPPEEPPPEEPPPEEPV